MLMLESIKVRNKLNGDHKRYSLSEMVSESYRVLYSCKRGTPLYKLVEAHINDVRENPTELEKLSENLHLLKQAAKLGSKVRINEDEIAQTKPDQTLTDESKTEDVDQVEGPDVIDEADERFQAKKSLLPTVDEIELKEKACKESIKKALGKKAVKESKRLKEAYWLEGSELYDVVDGDKEILAGYARSLGCPVYDLVCTNEELCSPEALSQLVSSSKEVTKSSSRSVGSYTYVSPEGVKFILVNEMGYNSIICDVSNAERLNLGDTAYESKQPVRESARSYKNCKKGLKNFCESSRSKAFYKTFKRMSESLSSKKPLTLAESISLYKAANSAMTQLAIELEHNPGFLKTFTECTSLLSRDTRNLLTCIKTKRAPHRSILESLSSFSNVLLEEDEPDWTEEQDEPVETPVDETPAEEEEITPEEAIADAIEAEIPEEVVEEIAEEVESVETPAEAVENVIEDISEEEAEDLLKYLYVMRQAEGATEEYAAAEVPEDFEAGDITDDELAELASHLKEARRIKRFKEARARRKQMKEALRPFSQSDYYGYDASKLPSGDAPMIGGSKDGQVDVLVSGDEYGDYAEGAILVSVIYGDEEDLPVEAHKVLKDQDTAIRLANGIISSYDSGKDIRSLLKSYKFETL